MKRYCFLILLSTFLFACKTEPNINGQELVSTFLKENNLDKRTTYLRASQENDSLLIRTESNELAEQFSTYVRQNHKGTNFHIKVVQPTTAFIRNSVSNSRSEGKHSGELATQYLMGQKVSVFDKKNNWYYVQGPDKYFGWIDAGGLIQEEDLSETWQKAEKVVVQANEAQAWQADNHNKVATDLVFGNTLGKLGQNEYILPSGRKVFIDDESIFLKPEQNDKIELAIEKAESLLGRPYLWGGTSTKGMDCSGFTRTSFLNAGYMLGRDASLQVHEGVEVNKENIGEWKRGDLLFFGNLREDGSQRITHVAIHTGDGRFIHSAGQVEESSLNPAHDNYNESRAKDLMRVKRIFTEE